MLVLNDPPVWHFIEEEDDDEHLGDGKWRDAERSTDRARAKTGLVVIRTKVGQCKLKPVLKPHGFRVSRVHNFHQARIRQSHGEH